MVHSPIIHALCTQCSDNFEISYRNYYLFIVHFIAFTVSDILLSSSLLYQTPGTAFNTFTSGINISNLDYCLFIFNIFGRWLCKK